MDTHTIFAYALMLIGAFIVVFSLYSAYGLYSNITATISYGFSLPVGSGSFNSLNVSAALKSITLLPGELQLGISLTAEIFLLFLFAYIGFKMMEIGLKVKGQGEKS